MAGIDLKGVDPWPEITAGAEIGGASSVLGMAGGDWLGLGLKVLGGLFGGGDSEQNQSASTGSAAINSSAWVIGEGDAEGGDLTAGAPLLSNVPWWGWAAGTLVAVAIIKKANS